jgi:hypothetical protein
VGAVLERLDKQGAKSQPEKAAASRKALSRK